MIKYVIKHKSWDKYICYENEYVDVMDKMEPAAMYDTAAEALDDLRIYISNHTTEKFSDYMVLTVQVCVEVVDVNEALPKSTETSVCTFMLSGSEMLEDVTRHMLCSTYHDEPVSFNVSVVQQDKNYSSLRISDIVWKE